ITQNIANPSPFRCGIEPCALSADRTSEGKKNSTRKVSRLKTIILSDVMSHKLHSFSQNMKT
ncbi:MAG: hypothetical protein VXA61_08255, partial [Candidatus Neomarinimicrobiota bacterium]